VRLVVDLRSFSVVKLRNGRSGRRAGKREGAGRETEN